MIPETGAGSNVIEAARYRHLHQVITAQRAEKPGLLETNP